MIASSPPTRVEVSGTEAWPDLGPLRLEAALDTGHLRRQPLTLFASVGITSAATPGPQPDAPSPHAPHHSGSPGWARAGANCVTSANERSVNESATQALAAAEADAARSRADQRRTAEFKDLIADMLQSIDAAAAATADTTFLERLLSDLGDQIDQGRLPKQVANTPSGDLVAAEVRLVLGSTHLRLAKHELAERHLGAALELARRAHGSGEQLAIEIAQRLAELYDATGRAAQALELRAQRR